MTLVGEVDDSESVEEQILAPENGGFCSVDGVSLRRQEWHVQEEYFIEWGRLITSCVDKSSSSQLLIL